MSRSDFAGLHHLDVNQQVLLAEPALLERGTVDIELFDIVAVERHEGPGKALDADAAGLLTLLQGIHPVTDEGDRKVLLVGGHDEDHLQAFIRVNGAVGRMAHHVHDLPYVGI